MKYQSAFEQIRNRYAELYDRSALAAIDELEAELPATFFAGLPLEKRVKRMVESWQKAITVNNDLEARNARLEAVAEDVEKLRNVYNADGDGLRWDIAYAAGALFRSLDALDD